MQQKPVLLPGARTELAVAGMNCGNCARRVTETLQKVPGVASITVELESRRAMVQWEGGAAPRPQSLLLALASAGYQAKALDAPEAADAKSGGTRVAGWHLNLWVGLAGTVPLMLGEWVFVWGMEPWFRWGSLVIASLVQVIAGGPFYQGAWHQLKAGRSSMDTLVALGSSTAFAYSLWALFSGHGAHLYFMEAAAIITLISVGHWIEARVGAQASDALRALLHLAPATARRRNEDGSESDVPVARLQVGDVLWLRPGDRVPVDAEVLEGESAVDESMLTGESIPVDKSARSPVYAGTMNVSGRLQVRVSATGEATALAQVIAAVRRAQNSRARIQRLADRVSNVFVPAVVLIAGATALWWGLWPGLAADAHQALAKFLWSAHIPETPLAAALIGAAAVLIIACPCAMGLATPAAIMASANVAARRGILIRDGVALEKAGQITAVVFDKTGTLTVGKPAVVAHTEYRQAEAGANADWPPALRAPAAADKAVDVGPSRMSGAARLAAALARHSNHPISQAVARLSPDEVELRDWQEVRGAGVLATLRLSAGATTLARLGSLRWLADCGVDLRLADEFVRQWTGHGATVLGLALGQTLVGALAIRDTVKTGARQVVEQLDGQGLKTYLVTGDSRRTAEEIARQAGIPLANLHAEVKPEDKALMVRKLQQEGARVAFVGDGINDAPALEQADLGIAVARASDVAREAADIILLKSEIEAVPESLGLARATLRTIKQNLFWAFFYNALAIPLAALGFMSPVLCAFAMGVSDLVVIGNALRLRRWRMRA